jgi:hypothetical protein
MQVPSFEPIASFEISTDICSDDDVHNVSMSSRLSPIPTDDESSINAFDYPLVQPDAIHVAATALGTSAANHMASLFEDALMDTSSIEYPVKAVEGQMGNHHSSRKPAKTASEFSCSQELVMDLLFCQAMDSATPFLEMEEKQQKVGHQANSGLCGQTLCHQEEGQESSP